MIKILIIDDDRNYCLGLVDVLKEKGYKAESQFTRKDAISAIENKSFDVILLDLLLPDSSGLKTLSEITKMNPTLPIVIISGYLNSKIIQKTLQEGAWGFMHKPLNIPRLLELIETVHKKQLTLTNKLNKNSKKKILLVDDNKNVRISLRDIFESEGYAVIETPTGENILEIINKKKPDLVLLDTELNVVEPSAKIGFEVCRTIKLVNKLPIKVVMYTGTMRYVNEDKAKQAGADDFIIKGEDPTILIKVINKYLM